ncbi:response regulator [Clostridium sp.]|uniref:response regulator n=1 Tax=Clostridium sp. TaxID=1506 RepID=UPI002FCC0F65
MKLIKVMIIEDDPMVRSINTKFLGKLEGFQLIGTAGDFNEAKELIKNLKPQLLLLDVYLPTGNGIDLLKWLRKEEPSTDVILITAERNIEAVQEAMRYGAVDYLVKPFELQRFKEALIDYKKVVEITKGHDKIEQNFIDEYLIGQKSGSSTKIISGTALCKGLNEITYNQIWEAINEGKFMSFTAEDLGSSIGMARVTVRRYLEFMVKQGKLKMDLEYGKIGRPTNVYKKSAN